MLVNFEKIFFLNKRARHLIKEKLSKARRFSSRDEVYMENINPAMPESRHDQTGFRLARAG